MKTIQLTHVELAVVITALANVRCYVELMSDRWMDEFKKELDALLMKLEN